MSDTPISLSIHVITMDLLLPLQPMTSTHRLTILPFTVFAPLLGQFAPTFDLFPSLGGSSFASGIIDRPLTTEADLDLDRVFDIRLSLSSRSIGCLT